MNSDDVSEEQQNVQQSDEPESKGSIEGDQGYVFFEKRLSVIDNENTSKDPIYFEKRPYKEIYHKKCLTNAMKCINRDPFVGLLLKALKSKGCEFIPERHLSCEPCSSVISGGFDVNSRQVAICENNSDNYALACGVLRHELLHAFDYCRAKVDFVKNLRHLACSEIRAAQFIHCHYLLSTLSGIISPFEVKNANYKCVKEKAAFSLLSVRNVDEIQAFKAVDEVFDVCYRDFEPFGRRIKFRTFENDSKRAYFEARYFGYYNGDQIETDF